MRPTSNRVRTLLLISLAVLACGVILFSSGATAKPPEGKGGGKGGGNGGGDGGNGNLPSFVVVDLGGSAGGAAAANDQAEFVGWVGNRAAYWRLEEQGVFAAPLPDIDGDSSEARDINNLGEAVGVESHIVESANGSTQLVYDALFWRITDDGISTVQLPSPLSGAIVSTEPRAVTDSGLIVGSTAAGDENGQLLDSSLVVWQVAADNQVHVFEFDEGWPDFEVSDVNNFGQVVGTGNGEAVLWQLAFDENGLVVGASEPIGLGTLGFPYSQARGINDAGGIAGRAFEDLESQNSESKAVLWHLDETGQVAATTEIPHVSDKKHWSSARRTNAVASRAIGASCELFRITFKPKVYVPRNCEPFLWHNGQTSALNDLISNFDGFTELIGASDMNAAGWICGTGSKNDERRAYVAIPD